MLGRTESNADLPSLTSTAWVSRPSQPPISRSSAQLSFSHATQKINKTKQKIPLSGSINIGWEVRPLKLCHLLIKSCQSYILESLSYLNQTLGEISSKWCLSGSSFVTNTWQLCKFSCFIFIGMLQIAQIVIPIWKSPYRERGHTFLPPPPPPLGASLPCSYSIPASWKTWRLCHWLCQQYLFASDFNPESSFLLMDFLISHAIVNAITTHFNLQTLDTKCTTGFGKRKTAINEEKSLDHWSFLFRHLSKL